MSKKKYEVSSNQLVITLNECKGEEKTKVMSELKEKGFVMDEESDFGTFSILFGKSETDLAELRQIKGVKAVEDEGRKETNSSDGG